MGGGIGNFGAGDKGKLTLGCPLARSAEDEFANHTLWHYSFYYLLEPLRWSSGGWIYGSNLLLSLSPCIRPVNSCAVSHHDFIGKLASAHCRLSDCDSPVAS